MDIIAYKEYYPGLMSRIIEMQAKYYHKFWNFGLDYEAMLAEQLVLFMSTYDEKKDLLLYALSEGQIIGSITINGDDKPSTEAELRWFIMDDNYIGLGVGTKLMDKALAFCQERNFSKIYLRTFKGLTMAQSLYEKQGFQLQEEKENRQWGPILTEQLYELLLV